MADMPYGSLSLLTIWKILWTLYHYQMTKLRDSTVSEEIRERRGSVLADRLDLDNIPESSKDIVQSVRGIYSKCILTHWPLHQITFIVHVNN